MKCWLTIDELDPLPLLLGGYPVKKLPAPVVEPEPAQPEALTTVARTYYTCDRTADARRWHYMREWVVARIKPAVGEALGAPAAVEVRP